MTTIEHTFIRQLKSTILQSRYQAAQLANQELLKLYFMIGKMLHEKIEREKWGAKVLEQISAQLQQELIGLRGFSAPNLKKMRLFYASWHSYFEIGSTVSIQFQRIENEDNSLPKAELSLSDFVSLGFSHHILILSKTTIFEERFFYIQQSAASFWSVRTLKHHLTNRLYHQQGQLPNNFHHSLSDAERQKALNVFKDEYLLDFINVADTDDDMDERLLEQEIVNNIKKFIMAIGNDFTFIGNQHRLIIAEREFYIDLLFYHRGLQCLVAFDLKRGEFKPEYLGKMNFYLSALDDLVKKAHEAPSIGIVLCKEKNNKIVEYTFRDMNKPMGVAAYKTTSEIPKEFAGVLPDPDSLKRLLE
jgi:predicted nuclease of restriction endonuclease-like (RecB) superfamily